jgi:hypothetical protein
MEKMDEHGVLGSLFFHAYKTPVLQHSNTPMLLESDTP